MTESEATAPDPDELELHRVCIIDPHNHLVDGQRLIVSSIEAWSGHFTIHYAWAVFPGHGKVLDIESVTDDRGNDYNLGGGIGSGGETGGFVMRWSSTEALDPLAQELLISFRHLGTGEPDRLITLKLRTVLE